MKRGGFASCGLMVATLGLAVPAGWNAALRAIGPLDLAKAEATSQVAVDRKGELLGAFTLSSGRWRLPVKPANVDPRFIPLLQSYEDKNFANHSGIDWLALMRAGLQWAEAGHIMSGGSTLAMQVARLLEPRGHRSLAAKVHQMIRAVQLVAAIGPDGILKFYLQLAPYGGNIEGIRAASLIWFGHEPAQMSWGEMALLVALPQSPEARQPDLHPAAATKARNRVIDRALAQGLLSQASAAAAKKEPIPKLRHSMPNFAPHATLAAHLATPNAPILPMTLDKTLQTGLQKAAKRAANRFGPQVSVALLVVDNASGEIRAHIGAPDYYAQESDGAIDMTRALRSPGSSLKPFIYALAFEKGLAHPETILEDNPTHYGSYAPKDFNAGFSGMVTARLALQHSLNLPAIALLSAVGPMRFLSRLRGAGANIKLPESRDPGLAVGIGGLGIRLYDIAKLYCGLARGGSMVALHERRDETPVGATAHLTSALAAYYVTDILRGVPPPTNAAGGRIAFKTGTSYGYRDALAIGYDAKTTITVWLGRADNGATPGLIGHDAAAPLLFEAFARLGRSPIYRPPPKGALSVQNSQLPPPLRFLHTGKNDVRVTGATINPVKIAYPPNGAKVDLDLGNTEAQPLALKAEGGAPPFTWLVNGQPIQNRTSRRTTNWQPESAGFAQILVLDAMGNVDSVRVRLQ